MDQSEKKTACKILKREFYKSGSYCNWRSLDQSGSVDISFGSLPSFGLEHKSADVKNMVNKPNYQSDWRKAGSEFLFHFN